MCCRVPDHRRPPGVAFAPLRGRCPQDRRHGAAGILPGRRHAGPADRLAGRRPAPQPALAFDLRNGPRHAADSIATAWSANALRPQAAGVFAACLTDVATLPFTLKVAATAGRAPCSFQSPTLARSSARHRRDPLRPAVLVVRHPSKSSHALVGGAGAVRKASNCAVARPAHRPGPDPAHGGIGLRRGLLPLRWQAAVPGLATPMPSRPARRPTSPAATRRSAGR